MSSAKRKRRAGKVEQLALNWREWGGERRGAGRKRTVRSRVAHRRRERVVGYEPLHVTTRCLAGLPSLRARATARELMERIAAGSERAGFRLVHYSLQRDHMHMIVEAEDQTALSRGVTGLAVRISRGLNRLWDRSGTVFADRFHSQVLRSPTEVRNTLRYVLNNVLKHQPTRNGGTPDPRSSSVVFDGWKGHTPPTEIVGVQPVVPPRSWLLRRGWLRGGGLLGLSEVPGGRPRRRVPSTLG